MTDQLVLPPMDDLHLHVREGDMLQAVLPHTMRCARRAIIMPNTKPAILTAADVRRYRKEINDCIKRAAALESSVNPHGFEPLMTIELRGNTTPEIIREAHQEGVRAAKIYPKNGTTNAADGFDIEDFRRPEVHEVFGVMNELGWKLLIHGEHVNDETHIVTHREAAFLETFEYLVRAIPQTQGLRIVLEHISDHRSVKLVEELPETVAATITAHHLFLTLNDVLGDGVRPHNMCMPVAKKIEDRKALREAATSGNPKFFAGSDSAPHPVSAKEGEKGACGAYTAPHLVELYATAFERLEALDKLEGFLCQHGADFYGLPRSAELTDSCIVLERREHQVPALYTNRHWQNCYMERDPSWTGPEKDFIVPFMAGETLPWKLVS